MGMIFPSGIFITPYEDGRMRYLILAQEGEYCTVLGVSGILSGDILILPLDYLRIHYVEAL